MFYRFFRAYVRLVLRVFFRSDEVSGMEHVPRTGPLLLVANHVNGLVNPLLFLAALDRRVTLTAKNTLGKNPLLSVLIRGLDIVLFHRAQDRGKGAEMRENARSMARCQEILGRGGAILIFPEGESHSDPGMRAFKPGAARIAADFVRRHPGERLAVVPAGLYFTRKDRFRSGVALRFGAPLPCGDLLAAGDRAAEVLALNAAAAEAIAHLTLDLKTEEESQLLGWAAEVLLARVRGPRLPGELVASALEELKVKRALHDGALSLERRAPERLCALEERVGAHHRRLRELGLEPAEIRVRHTVARSILFTVRELEIAVVGLAWALLGILSNALPYLLVDGIARLTSRDLDHWATQKIYPSLLLYPLCYLGQAGLVLALFGPIAAGLSLPAFPLFGGYALLWRERMRDALRRVRTFLALLGRPGLSDELVSEGDAIYEEILGVQRELLNP